MVRIVWLAAHGALFLVVIRLFDALLLRRFLDAPWMLAAWLVTARSLVFLLRDLASRTPGEPRSYLQRAWLGLDRSAVALLLFLAVLVFVSNWGYQRASSDGREYFVQVRSLVMDGDLDFANENSAFGVRGTANIYPFGGPLLWAPFFLLAHAWLWVLNLFGAGFARDGYVNAYQQAIGLGTLVYGFTGLLLIVQVLQDYFRRGVAVGATIVVFSGSFLIWYLAVEASMVHGVSMFATTLFLYIWHRTRRGRSLGQWAALGAAAGLMTMVRWQNALFVVFAVVDMVRQYATVRPMGLPGRLRTALTHHGAFIACGVLAFLPQMIFWAITREGPFDVPTGEHQVAWLSPMVGEVLFSSNHGLFSWSPLLYLAVVGALVFVRRDPLLGGLLLLGLVGQIYANSIVEMWWGGAGFGARRFANCALLFALGMASLMSWLRDRPLVAPACVLGSFVALNTFFMIDVKGPALPTGEGITFDQMLESAYARIGNPFSIPKSAWVAWKYGANLSLYDRLSRRTYNTLVIDFGEPADDQFLVSGWSGRERGRRDSFRWSDADESSFVVPLREAVNYRLELRCRPFVYPGGPEQSVMVIVNGHPVEQLPLRPGFRNYQVAIPAQFMQSPLNEIRFRYGYAISPRAVGRGGSSRRLGVAFDVIRLVRQS